MKIKNHDEVVTTLRPFLRDYLEEHGLDTSKNFCCINPSHNDKTPSCNIIKTDTNIFYCHGCSVSGDIFTACHYLENKPLVGREFLTDNLIYLAGKYNIEVDSAPLTEEELYRIDTFKAYQYAADYIAQCNNTENFEEALRKREWKKDICFEYGIGTVDEYKKFREYLKSLGFAAGFLDDVDLSREDIFNSDNLIFTIKDERGRPVGFSARNLLYTSDKKSGPKYNNSRTTGVKCNIYKKASRLYGIDKLILKHSKKEVVYIVEGQADVITSVHEGITNCVGLMGSSFSLEQLCLLKDFGFYNICLMLDADETGQKKTLDILDTTLVNQRDLKVSVVCLPEGLDPDDFLRTQGIRAFEKLKHWSAFEWRLNQFPEEMEPETICEKMVPIIANETAAVQRDKLEKALSVHTGLLTTSIHKDVERLLNSHEMEKQRERRNILERLRYSIERYPDNAEVSISEAEGRLFELAKSHNEDSFSEEKYLLDLKLQKEEEETKDGSFPGFLLGYDLRPFEKSLCGDWKKDVWCCLGGSENSGKCQTGNTKILLSDGSYKRLKEVVRDKDNKVISMMNDFTLKQANVIDWITTGKKKCYKMTLSSFEDIEGSIDHKYFTLEGWKRLEDLKVGDKIAIARDYRSLGNLKSPISKSEAIILAAFLAEGSLTSYAGFSNTDEELVSLFKKSILNVFPNATFRHDDDMTYVTDKNIKSNINRVYEYLKEYNLFYKNAHKKIIPDDIFKCSLKRIGIFLGMFFACDGWVTSSGGSSSFEIGISLCNLEMIKQIKSLLLRFGIRPRISYSTSAYTGSKKRFNRYTITINDVESVRLFYNNIRLPLKRKQERIREYLLSNRQSQGSYRNNFPSSLWSYIKKKTFEKGLSFNGLLRLIRPLKSRTEYDKVKDRFKSAPDYKPNIECGISPDILKTIAHILNDDFLISLSSGDIIFEKVSLIEDIGYIDCFDLTIEGTHNYIANDIISHNSSWLLKLLFSLVNISENNACGIYHSIDDTKNQLIPRCVCLAEGGRKLTINKVVNPDYFIRSGLDSKDILTYRDKGYDKLMDLGRNGRFIMKDANDGYTLSYVERLIRYYKDKYSDRDIIYVLDNFHKLQDFESIKGDERIRFKAMSTIMKNLATKYHICMFSTVEYTKLPRGTIPSNNNVGETKQIAYDANLICHLYSDFNEWGDDAKHFHIGIDGEGNAAKMPRVMLDFGKNKISSYRGRQWYDFFPEQADFNFVEASVVEETEKEKEEHKNRFEKIAANGLVE
jgi:DNA primase catalytic core